MFIRNNPRKGHDYYNVVRGVREEGTIKQEQVVYIGRVDTMTPERRREIEAELRDLDEVDELLGEFRELLIEHDYDFPTDEEFTEGYALDEITPTQAVDYGPVRAVHAMAEKLKLEDLLEEHMMPKGGGPPLAKLQLILILSRCLEPKSIAKTVDWYRLTALPELLGLPVEEVTYDALRNSLNYVPEDGMERVHEALWERTQELYETPDSPLHYDLTSSYFEGIDMPLAEYGYSRDHRPDKQQIVVGVTVNPDMVPIQHDVYPGNTNDSPTVQGVVERLADLDIDDPLLVGDKGVITAPNRKGIRGDDEEWEIDPIDYVGPRKRTQPVKDVLARFDPSEFEQVEVPDGANPIAVYEIDPAEDFPAGDDDEFEPHEDVYDDRLRWILAYNESRAGDEAETRQKKLTTALEELEEVAETQYGDDPRSKKDLQKKANKAVPKAVDELVDRAVNERGRPRLSFDVDEDAVDQAAALDGKTLFETTRGKDRLSAASVALAYRDRDTVERFIRTTKEITDLRPFYVRLEEKIRALVFFCVLGVHLIALLQLELEEAGKDITGMEALQKLRGIRRVEMSVEDDEATVLKTTEMTDDQAELLHVFK